MISEITFSTSVVTNSITNSDATVTIDNIQPLSFLEFIKNTNVDYSPEEYNNFYLNYLKQWATVINSKTEGVKVNFIELYVNFLKDLVITYSTQSELKFLSTLDYNDPVDLDIAIPIYVEKIRQIIIFYKEKRDEAKYVIDRSRIKGNSKSIEKAIFEKIYNYIFTSEQQPQYSLLNVSLSSIVLEMKIDIEEFVDVYGNYFDLPKENTSISTLRDELYTSNINSIDPDTFFSVVQPGTIFRSSIFLNELPLAINYAVTVDLICDPTNPLLLVNTDNKCGFSAADKERLKRELVSKYIGVDFYYISTLNNSLCSGRFITAQNPTSNICNLQTADTATVQSNEVKLLRDLGLFFKPDTNGIFQLNSNNFTYSVDETKLEEDKVYIFPDPNVYGNVSVNSQEIYPLIFIHDYTKDVKGISSGFASGDPKINNYEQTFSPYFAKDQSINISSENNDSYKLNFSDLYNRGYITKVQYDIYGNEYALFKDEFGHTFKSVTNLTNTNYILDLLLDGHVFRDIYEGYNFNYSTVGMQDSLIRSGLSSQTVNNFTTPSFTLTGWPLTLSFREFTPYDEYVKPVRNIISKLRDGGEFTDTNSTALPDSILADSQSYPGNGMYYYTTLADGGVSDLDPLTRANISTLTGDFTLNVATLYALENVEEYDCGRFTDDTSIKNSFDYSDNIPYYESVSSESQTIISTISGENILKSQAYKDKLLGNLFVKSQHYSNAYPLATALYSTFDKYNSNVKSEVYGKIKDFDIIYDTIVCETNSYLVIDKINYDGEFVVPYTKNTYFTRNSAQPINKFSNRFFNEIDKTLTFCIMDELTEDFISNLATQKNEDILTEAPLLENIQAYILNLSGSNYKIILPTIYQYDILQNATVQVFPRVDDILNYSINIFSLRDYFTSEFNINIIKVDKPIIAYNSFNRMYKLTYTCTDSNNMFYIFDIDFIIRNNAVTFYNGKFYKQDKVVNTTSFYNLSDSRASAGFAIITGNLSKEDGTIVL